MSAGLTHKDCRVACQEQDLDCGAKNTVQKEGRESHPDRLFADKKEARRELKELAQGLPLIIWQKQVRLSVKKFSGARYFPVRR